MHVGPCGCSRGPLPYGRWGPAVLLALGAMATAGASAQPTVRVRGESRIELRTERTEGGVILRGHLHDDLGEPLADRTVELELIPEGGTAPAHRRRVATDHGGAFREELPVARGRHRVRATFGGDDTHDRVEVVRTLDLSRADVRLQLQVPSGGRLDLGDREHEVTVWAASPAGSGGLEIDLRDELDRLLASGTTDPAGRLRLQVPSEVLGPPGAGRLTARFSGDPRRNAAQTEVAVVRQRETDLTLAMEGGDEGEVRLYGRLGDGEGPLPDRAVGLFTEARRHVATVLTDEEGRFEHVLDPDRRGSEPLVVRARFDSGSPGLTSSTSPPMTLPAAPAPPTPWPWLLVPMALSFVLLLLLGRRRARPSEPADFEASRPRPAGVEAGAPAGRAADRTDVGGRVCDSRDGQPVAGAMATLTANDGEPLSVAVDARGRFHRAGLAEGTWKLRIEAEGYAPVDAEIAVPHRGQWSGTTVRMDSYRALVLRPFRRVVQAWIPSLGDWATRTNREVGERARARGAGPRFDALVSEVERAYYGPTPPTRGEVDTVERHADEVLREASGADGPDEPSVNVDGRSHGSL